jgi:2-methylcitrate dehydratase PrpD
MKRRKAAQGAQGVVDRREFLETAGKYTVTGLAAGGTIESLGKNSAMAVQIATSNQAEARAANIARFTVNTRYEALPPKALEWARIAMIDCLAVAVAGSREESSKICAELARQEKAAEEATVYGHGFKSSAAQAAFANGIAAHATDFDHSFVIGGQPSAPIIPAVFALGESLGANGKQVLEAYIAGFEVAAQLTLAGQEEGGAGVPPGVFGAAAACAKLLRLKESEIEMALGIASAMVSGLGTTQGTMGKPLGVGLAARAGVLAARMAKAGFTAGQPNLPVLADLGQVYALEKYGVRLKAYPCGGLTHTAIYATIQLRNQHSITEDVVDHIDVEVPQGTANTIMYAIPETGLQGKFSMGYLIARALIDGKLMLDAFTDQAVRDEKVLRLVKKVEMKIDPSLPSSQSADGSRPATVTIRLNNGQTHRLNQRFPKGSPQLPMTPDELREKVRACARGVIGAAPCERAMAYVSTLETMANIRPLAEQLRAGARKHESRPVAGV